MMFVHFYQFLSQMAIKFIKFSFLGTALGNDDGNLSLLVFWKGQLNEILSGLQIIQARHNRYENSLPSVCSKLLFNCFFLQIIVLFIFDQNIILFLVTLGLIIQGLPPISFGIVSIKAKLEVKGKLFGGYFQSLNDGLFQEVFQESKSLSWISFDLFIHLDILKGIQKIFFSRRVLVFLRNRLDNFGYKLFENFWVI